MVDRIGGINLNLILNGENRRKMAKIVFYTGIILLSITAVKQIYAAEAVNGVSRPYSKQVELYRKLLTEADFYFRYNPGDSLKYRVQLRTWSRRYVDAGPRAFDFDAYDILLKEKVSGVSEEDLIMDVKVAYKNTKEPLYWGGDIAIQEINGTVAVKLNRDSWIPEISNRDIKPEPDFDVVAGILKRIIAQIHMPVFLPKISYIYDGPSYLKKNINTCAWMNDGHLSTDIYSSIREFGEFKKRKCAIIDTTAAISSGNKQINGMGIGTVYFDYENGRMVKMDYRSEESANDKGNKLNSPFYCVMEAEILE